MGIMRLQQKPLSPAIGLALLAAALYGIGIPLARLLLASIPAALMASLLYFGAGLGMLAVRLGGRLRGSKPAEARMNRRDWPPIAAMIVLDIAAPILLMLALERTSPASVSLLNNFEIVATALVALLAFREAIGRRMWLAIGLITAATLVLSLEDAGSLSFSAGSILVILACICWGIENNCTRLLSIRDPLQVVVLKGLGSGTGSLAIALMLREVPGGAAVGAIGSSAGGAAAGASLLVPILLALLLGFVSYGLSIYCYIRAQRDLGAARTSAYYAAAPFIGAIVSFLVVGQAITPFFAAAAVIMVAGAWLAASEHHRHWHVHEPVTHEHRHRHDDQHHLHTHDPEQDHAHDEKATADPDADPSAAHTHVHTHPEIGHEHEHSPDLHHRHRH